MSSKKKKKPIQEAQPQATRWTKVTHMEYTAVQSKTSLHIAIGKGGKVVGRYLGDHAYTEEELKDAIEEFIALRSRLG